MPTTSAETGKCPLVLLALFTQDKQYRWPEATTRAWWRWAVASQDPRVRAMVQATERAGPTLLGMRDARAKQRQWQHYLHDHLTPQLVGKGLEALVAQGALSRLAANTLEDDLLEKVTRQGTWKKL